MTMTHRRKDTNLLLISIYLLSVSKIVTMTDERKDKKVLLKSTYLLSVSMIVTKIDRRKDIKLLLISIYISLTHWEVSFVLTKHYFQVTNTKFVG